jgi:adenylate cyclase
MPQEIERKYLVKENFKPQSGESFRIVQGFLSTSPHRTVRIRIKGEKGFINIKGMISASGMSRYEWEKEIPLFEAEELMKLCEPGIVEKTRHLVRFGKHVYEVDAFLGDNEGLIIAEIELGSESEKFEKPDWLGKEVTGDVKYYNAMLAVNPFSKWKKVARAKQH